MKVITLPNGAKFGAEGKVFSVPKAVIEAVAVDPARADETILWSEAWSRALADEYAAWPKADRRALSHACSDFEVK